MEAIDLKKCQIFTPKDIVVKMLDLAFGNNNIFGKKIIDNSCGDGAFLEEIVKRYIADGKKKRKNKKEIKKQLELNIVGYEVDASYAEKCVDKLEKVAQTASIYDVNWQIKVEDGLYIDNDGEFDYVVGNPPYITYVDLSVELRKKLRKDFQSCGKGKFDYLYAFIEKGMRLLNANGIMIYITPSNWFKTVFGNGLRAIIKSYIRELINYPADTIFHGVLTSPAISLFDKNISSILHYVEINNGQKIIDKFIDKTELIDKWDFRNDNKTSKKRRFGDYFQVSNAIATLANNIFIHDTDSNGMLSIDVEDEILRPTVSPRSIRYGKKQQIIYPYYYENGKLKRYSIEEMYQIYPKTMRYLSSQKDLLDKRDSDRNAEFFEFGRSQAIIHLNQEKLMIAPIVTNEVKVYLLDRATIPYSGMYVIPRENMELNEAKDILETVEFYNYVKCIGVNVNGNSLRISSKDIENYRF